MGRTASIREIEARSGQNLTLVKREVLLRETQKKWIICTQPEYLRRGRN
jgi:hypothetical protein